LVDDVAFVLADDLIDDAVDAVDAVGAGHSAESDGCIFDVGDDDADGGEEGVEELVVL
jgi:hypothetical protein